MPTNTPMLFDSSSGFEEMLRDLPPSYEWNRLANTEDLGSWQTVQANVSLRWTSVYLTEYLDLGQTL